MKGKGKREKECDGINVCCLWALHVFRVRRKGGIVWSLVIGKILCCSEKGFCVVVKKEALDWRGWGNERWGYDFKMTKSSCLQLIYSRAQERKRVNPKFPLC